MHNVGIIALSILLLLVSACSPLHVVQSGVEQARILNRRVSIDSVIIQDQIDAETRRKLELVIAAREFSKELGLDPKNTFQQYSQVDRDVLLWVLSAAEKTSFSPVAWWFPIVGRIPYKGFFERYDGLREFERLKRRGYDVYLRPSVAYSSIGWFDDPVVSTFLTLDDVGIVETVIHEIVHTTFWIVGEVQFNETMANSIGLAGAIAFFSRDPATKQLAQLALARFEDEIKFGHFIAKAKDLLDELYKQQAAKAQNQPRKQVEKETLLLREQEFERIKSEWEGVRTGFKTDYFRNYNLLLNNAAIVALDIYLRDMDLFYQLYLDCNQDALLFIEALVELKDEIVQDRLDPWEALRDREAP